jgi:hypothetical protein
LDRIGVPISLLNSQAQLEFFSKIATAPYCLREVVL